jgi:hypothetical protein
MNINEERKLRIELLTENLLYNQDLYSLTVYPSSYSSSNIVLKFHELSTGASIKLTIFFVSDEKYIYFENPSDILRMHSIFELNNAEDLSKEIIEQIRLISNQHSFINCFLFGQQQCSFDNNYKISKINTPADIITFSTELKPFAPQYCLSSALNVKFIIKDDFSGVDIYYFLNARINGELYTGTPQNVFNELLTRYAGEVLGKNLEDLTLSDHTLLAMVKI